MNKRLPFILLSTLAISLVGCNKTGSGNSDDDDFTVNTNDFSKPSVDNSASGGEEVPVAEYDVALHFRHPSFNLDDYEMYTWDWADSNAGKAKDWSVIDQDNHEATYYINTADYKNPDKIGIIVRSEGSWSWQTPDQFVIASTFTAGTDGIKHIWAVLGAGDVLQLFATAEEAMGDRVKTAQFDSFDTLTVEATAKVDHYYIYENGAIVTYGSPEKDRFSVKLPREMEPHNVYTIESYFTNAETGEEKVTKSSITLEKLYDTENFVNKYVYTGENPLGVSFENGKTIFRLWAPVCSEVTLNIYESGTAVNAVKGVEGDNTKVSHKLARKVQGVYELSLDGDLSGKYYTYTVNNYSGVYEVTDPYAISTGVNGDRGFIYDLNRADSKPEGWDNISFKPIKSVADLTVYETHVADITMSSTWTGTEEYRGTFKGMIEKGTTYSEGGVTVKTGFDHINELGVNAIQILPFYDADNDEMEPVNGYNWGYNPKNYNAVEGIYSTDPFDGLARIKELRETVLALSKTDVGTRVIMDVVYNHVASAYSVNFNFIVPKYYFRYDNNGKLLNGSGCGNEFKTESDMGRRFIKDSLVHWAKNYQIKGFRFDLMGLIDCETLKVSAEALYKVDPSIVAYGEAWMAMGDWGTAVSNMQAVSDNVFKYLYAYEKGQPTDKPDWDTESRIAVGSFNDAGRDAMRGSHGGEAPGSGWITGGGNQGRVYDMLIGSQTDKGANPTQVVNYLSCHDNYTAYDQIAINVASNKTTEPSLDEVGKAVVGAYGAVFFSQGIAFMQSGDEFLRTKVEIKNEDGTYQGSSEAIVNMFGKDISHNSYMSHPDVNALHYDRKIDALKTYNKFVEAIKVRNYLDSTVFGNLFPDNCDATKVSTFGEVTNGYGVSINANDTTYYVLAANKNGSNISIDNQTVKVLYSSSERFTANQTFTISNGKLGLEAYECVVLVKA